MTVTECKNLPADVMVSFPLENNKKEKKTYQVKSAPPSNIYKYTE